MSKVNEVLLKILDQFENGQIPATVAISCFPSLDIPSAKWSFYNRILMTINNTDDARGFRQWKSVGRYPVKGSKGFYILVPLFVKEKKEGKQVQTLKGFKTAPVFRLEDTEGEPLNKEELKLPQLPLIERAEEWGVRVVAIPGNSSCYGYYSPQVNKIALATPEEAVFFHELAHCADNKLRGLKRGQEPLQEIVAELSAHALCIMVGKAPVNIGNHFKYISRYAKQLDMTATKACMQVLHDVEQVINLIIGGQNGQNKSSL